MKFSVVTISYNQEKYIKRCIESVLAQDYPNIEYIIVDAGSTDTSREIISKYAGRVKTIFEKDNGPSDGLNKGFSIATGDVFYFINSDDYVLPNTFSFVASQFSQNVDMDVLLGGGIQVDGSGTWTKSHFPSRISAKAYVNGAVTLFQQGMFFKAETFREVGGFNNSNSTSWDGELLLNFIVGGARFRRTMRQLGAFRVYPESITGSQRFSQQFDRDQRRMYRSIYKKDRSLNLLSRYYFRLQKLIFDPKYLFMRLLYNLR